MVLEKIPDSPLDNKEVKPVSLKRNQLWILIQRTDAKAEAPLFWSSDANSWLTVNTSDAGKDWGQKEKSVVRGWDNLMASPKQCTWTWANFRRWRGTGRLGVLPCMRSQRVGYNWATERQHHDTRMGICSNKDETSKVKSLHSACEELHTVKANCLPCWAAACRPVLAQL